MLTIDAKKFLGLLKPVKDMLPNGTTCAIKCENNNIIFNVLESSMFYAEVNMDILKGDLEGIYYVSTDQLIKVLKFFNTVNIKGDRGTLWFTSDRSKYSVGGVLPDSDGDYFAIEKNEVKKYTVLENKKFIPAMKHIFEDKEGGFGPDQYIWIKDGFIWSSYYSTDIESMVRIPTITNTGISDEGFFSIHNLYGNFISKVKENFKIFKTKKHINIYNSNYFLHFSALRQFSETNYLVQAKNFADRHQHSEEIFSFDSKALKEGLSNLLFYFGVDLSEGGVAITKEGDRLFLNNLSKDSNISDVGKEEYVINAISDKDFCISVDSNILMRIMNCSDEEVVDWKLLISEEESPDGNKYCDNYVTIGDMIQGFGGEIIV